MDGGGTVHTELAAGVKVQVQACRARAAGGMWAGGTRAGEVWECTTECRRGKPAKLWEVPVWQMVHAVAGSVSLGAEVVGGKCLDICSRSGPRCPSPSPPADAA